MFFVAQAAVKKMLETPDRKARGGAVINITSQRGQNIRGSASMNSTRPHPNLPPHAGEGTLR
jgi:NAD(P)-dependent dehydrogenase (short-subunit alcohol dehydrogenase family)